MEPHTIFFFFFFNDTATTEIYTLSLHDALPIYHSRGSAPPDVPRQLGVRGRVDGVSSAAWERRASRGCSHLRSEEHTSELQSRPHLVCRLLLEKKKEAPRGLFQSAVYIRDEQKR